MQKYQLVNLNFLFGYRCNYSCVGCITNSDRVSDDHDPDIDKVLSVVPTMASLFEVTSMITLLGGEPFLYWNDRIVPLAREVQKYFPGTLINIFTNGQLLGKNVDRIFSLAGEIDNLSISITHHVNGHENTTQGRLWKENFDQFAADPRIIKIHDHHYHVKGNVRANIYVHTPDTWIPTYRRLSDGSIKPFATNDPENSYRIGCSAGPVCSAVIGTRLYKCTSLGTLEHALAVRGQSDDKDWEKYLNYPYIDLENIDAERLKNFGETHRRATPWCDMCTNDHGDLTTVENRTFEMIFSR